jgi:hypothetical protein
VIDVRRLAKGVSLNVALQSLNLLVLLFFVFADSSHTYLHNSREPVYLLLLASILSILVNSFVRNICLDILNLFFTGFYVARIPFLYLDGYLSDVITRAVPLEMISEGIDIIVIQYLVINIAILLVNPLPCYMKSLVEVNPRVSRMLLQISFLIIVLNALRPLLGGDACSGYCRNIIAILKTVFSEDSALLLMVAVLTIGGKKTFVANRILVALSIVSLIAFYLLSGSKGAIFQLILFSYLAFIAIRGVVVIRWKSWFVVSCSFVGAVGAFLLAKISRAIIVNGFQFDSATFFLQVRKFYLERDVIDTIVSAFSYRVGYLDFYIQKISNSIYYPYVDLEYYWMAVVDKVTPGFDIYNLPFASRAIFSAYNGASAADVLNSEIITVFAESHILFSFGSLFLYLTVMFAIRAIYVFGVRLPPEARALTSAFAAFSFYWWLVGSGLDMTLMVVIYKGIFVASVVLLILFLYKWDKGKERAFTKPATVY